MSWESSNYCDRWSDDFYDVETCPQEWNWNLQTHFSYWPLDSCQVIIAINFCHCGQDLNQWMAPLPCYCSTLTQSDTFCQIFLSFILNTLEPDMEAILKTVGLNFSQHSEAFQHFAWSFSALSFRKNCFNGIFRDQNKMFEWVLTYTASHQNYCFKQQSYCVDLVMNWLDFHELIWSISPALYLASNCCGQC